MPIDLTFDDDVKLGTATYQGTIQADDFTQYISRWNQPRYMDYNELVLINEVQTEYGELIKHSNQVRHIDPRFIPNRRTAIVPIHPAGKSFAEFWKAAYESGVSGEREIKIFDSKLAARDWVTDPA